MTGVMAAGLWAKGEASAAVKYNTRHSDQIRRALTAGRNQRSRLSWLWCRGVPLLREMPAYSGDVGPTTYHTAYIGLRTVTPHLVVGLNGGRDGLESRAKVRCANGGLRHLLARDVSASRQLFTSAHLEAVGNVLEQFEGLKYYSQFWHFCSLLDNCNRALSVIALFGSAT